jgi:hypothetical protein
MKYAIIKNGIVENIIEADEENANIVAGRLSAIAVQSDTAGINDSYSNGTFINPGDIPEPAALTAIKSVLASEIDSLNAKYPTLALTADDTILSAIPKLLGVEALKSEVVYLKMLYDTVKEAQG